MDDGRLLDFSGDVDGGCSLVGDAREFRSSAQHQVFAESCRDCRWSIVRTGFALVSARMNLHGSRTKAQRGYDRLAPFYQTLEKCLFGARLQAARTALLSDLPQVSHAVFLGDGDGRLLRAFCQRQPNCRVTSLDQSQAMLEKQRQGLAAIGAASRVAYIQADVLEDPLSALTRDKPPIELLVTAFFWDCFTQQQLASLIEAWINAIEPGGYLYVVDFCHPNTKWRRIQSAIYQSLMHVLFRFQTGLPNRRLIELTPMFDRPDLKLQREDRSVHPMLFSRLYQKREAYGSAQSLVFRL